MTMTTSRQRVLAYLQKHKTATASEISRTLGMTTANARHHLAILEKSGVIACIEEKKRGRGRPSKRYALQRVARGEGIERLTSHLLDVCLDSVSEASPVLDALAARLAGEVPHNSGMMQRFASAMRRLDALGYDARWEAHAEGPRVLLGQCPYAALLPKHPELCQMDAALLELLLDAEIHPLVTGKARAAACIFLVEPR